MPKKNYFQHRDSRNVYQFPKHYNKFTALRQRTYKLPDLIEAQRSSYKWFWKKGLRNLLDEFSPIKDWGGKDLELSFGDYRLDEPNYSEIEAKARNVSYEASLYCRVKLTNNKTKEIKEQEIFLGDFPLMTERGTFIVNAVERVVISQLIRSSGVFFVSRFLKGQQLFGAKIIPTRGAWLEFETDSDGVIGVKIDRKRKVPVTSLMRVFATIEGEKFLSDKALKKFFTDIDNGEINHIEATLSKDPAKTVGESFIEAYKRIRPGDLATEDNARSFIEAMFSFDRYDLGEVGRWKMGQRLARARGIKARPLKRDLRKSRYLQDLALKKTKDGEITRKEKVLCFEDLKNIVREIIILNNAPGAKPDDIDHLGNRRVKSMGELLQNKLRVGMARTEKIIRDRMSTLDPYDMVPGQLVNARPFIASAKEFFSSSQLSQFMDQHNPLAELEHKRRLSAMGPGGLTRERAGFEVRDVHSSHYGRICPIHTSEGPNIGLIGHLTICARLNDYGFIETPYQKVNKERLTKEIVYLNAFEEERYNIAHAGVTINQQGQLMDKMVEARVMGQPSTISRSKIDFIDVMHQQPISVATSLIPFLEHDDSNRALMGSNMQRQAVACVKPQSPLVGTGMEEKAARDSGCMVIAEEDCLVDEVDASHIKLKLKNRKSKTHQLRSFTRTNQYTCVCQMPLVRNGQRVKKGDVLVDGASTDKGRLALGQNLLVAFMSWRGYNFEDAIILSQKLVKDDRFTSIHIESFTCHVRETKLGNESTTPDIPNVGEERLKDLDEEGIVRIGAEVNPNDILVGKISPKGETDLTAEERLLQAIFGEKARDVKDASLRMRHGKRGRVVGIKIFSRDNSDKLPSGVIKSIQVEVAQLRKISVGDKIAGRHGNKGVIARILPEEDMPYLEDGTPIEIILNPLGVASRMNVGQILETHLGWAAKLLGYQAITPALAGFKENEIKEELKKAGLPEDGKVVLRDGRNGEPFEQPITVGYIYMMKLLHLVEDKIHMRSVGPYSLITQQPLGGKAQFGGQRFGEMEVWALEGYGAAHTLQEMLTIKSDDISGRTNVYDAIIRGKEIQAPNIPASFNVLISELKALGLGMELVEK